MSTSVVQRVWRGILLPRDFQIWPEDPITCMSAIVGSSWFCFSFICFLFICFSFIWLQITVSSGGMLVQKLNISDLQSGNGTFDGTMVYAQNKVQSLVLKTKPSTCLLGGLYHLLCKKLLLSHCIQPIQRCTSNNLQKYDACIPSWTESMGRLPFDLIQVSRGRTVFSWQTLSACLVLTYSLQQVDMVSKSSVTTLKVSLWPGYGLQWPWWSLTKLSNKSNQDEQGYISAMHALVFTAHLM